LLDFCGHAKGYLKIIIFLPHNLLQNLACKMYNEIIIGVGPKNTTYVNKALDQEYNQ